MADSKVVALAGIRMSHGRVLPFDIAQALAEHGRIQPIQPLSIKGVANLWDINLEGAGDKQYCKNRLKRIRQLCPTATHVSRIPCGTKLTLDKIALALRYKPRQVLWR